MARALSYLALMLAYLATLLYIAAMCTPWWYTKYYIPNGSDNNNANSNSFFGYNPSLNADSQLFSRSNCFIDGSCITGDTIYKNNGHMQWVYTTTLVLMIVGWIPWLIFLHLLHFRANKNRSPMTGRRTLMAITAILTMLFLLAAIIVFAAGMVKSNGIYNSGGLYGSHASDGNWGSMPDGHGNNAALTAGARLSCYALNDDSNDNDGNPSTGNANGNGNGFHGWLNNNCPQINGTIGYKWGAHAAWYFAILAFALIPLALLLGLLIKVKETVVRQERTVQRTVTTQPAVVQQPVAQAAFPQPTSYVSQQQTGVALP